MINYIKIFYNCIRRIKRIYFMNTNLDPSFKKENLDEDLKPPEKKIKETVPSSEQNTIETVASIGSTVFGHESHQATNIQNIPATSVPPVQENTQDTDKTLQIKNLFKMKANQYSKKSMMSTALNPSLPFLKKDEAPKTLEFQNQKINHVYNWVIKEGNVRIKDAQASAEKLHIVPLKMNTLLNYNLYVTGETVFIEEEDLSWRKEQGKEVKKVISVADAALRKIEHEVQILTLFSKTQEQFSKFNDNEMSILFHIAHSCHENKSDSQHFVQIRSVSAAPFTESNAFLAEYCNGGTVENALSKFKNEESVQVAILMAQSLARLHELNVVHRDLKLDNFLIVLDEIQKIKFVKITDFGSSSFKEEKEQQKISYRVDFPKAWKPPEAFQLEKVLPSLKEEDFKKHFEPLVSDKFDIFQLGISYYQLFSKKKIPFINFAEDRILKVRGTLFDKIKIENSTVEITNIKSFEVGVPDNQGQCLINITFTEPSEKMLSATLSTEELQEFKEKMKNRDENWPDFEKLPIDLKNLIKQMLDTDYTKRPPLSEVIKFLIQKQ
jgi:serine/threonine protein kinase